MKNNHPKILYKFPSRGRPHQFLMACSNIMEQSQSGNYAILAAIDKDDHEAFLYANEIQSVNRENNHRITAEIGYSKNKIDAVNRGSDNSFYIDEWDILICMSDDMRFIKRGFDEIIRADFAKYFPDFDGVLHYPDGNRNDLMTMSIIGRKYFERDGYIYHPDYVSLWADMEAQEVAKLRGKYQFINTRLFDHLHPNYGKAPMDELYAKENTVEHDLQDRATYERRKALNFGL